MEFCSSGSGDESENDASSECSAFGTVVVSSTFDISAVKVVAGTLAREFKVPTAVSFR